MPGTLLLEDLNRANDDELVAHLNGLFGPGQAPGGGYDPSNIIPRHITVAPPEPVAVAEPEPQAPPAELADFVQSIFKAPAPSTAAAAPTPTPATPTPAPTPADGGDVVQQLADEVGQATGLTWIGEGLTNLRQGAQQAATGLTNLVRPQPAEAPTAPTAAPGGGEVNPQPSATDVRQYITQAAHARGIDPDIALRVAQSEGGFEAARRGTFKTGSSWWPFQLHYGGKGYEHLGNVAGMGNRFTAETGFLPGDPMAWQAATDFALDEVKRKGWGQWYGAQAQGITGFQGVDRNAPDQPTVRRTPSASEGITRAGAALGAANDISQFGDAQLTNSQAYAACGPAAAVRFAQRFGRNPTLSEAVDMARTVGWTEQQGMAGLGSEKALMDKMGVPTKMVTGPQWDVFAREAQSGNPVTISTSAHYFFADGYDPGTGRFHVGRSGLDLKGGKEWMTSDEIVAAAQRLGGGNVQGALLADNPQAPTSTLAGTTTPEAPQKAPGRARTLQVLEDEGQTAAGFTAPGGPGRGFPEQAAGAVGEGFSRLGEAAQGALTVLDDAVNASASNVPNPTPASVPGGGYDPTAFRREPTPPPEGTPLRQDVRDLNIPPQPTIFEQIGEMPGLSEADRAARRQALEESPLGQAYGSDVRKELLPNITEPNHPFNVMAELQDKYEDSADPLNLRAQERMTPEDRQRWTDAQMMVGGMAAPVNLKGLAALRAGARASATAAAAGAPPTPPANKLDKLLAVGVNNMLGGTASMFNNAVSGVSENLYRPFKTALVQGEFGPALQDVRAQGAAIGDALSDMGTTFTTGERLSKIGGADYPEAFPGKVGMLPFTSGNLRANAAMDEGNRAVAMAGGMAAEMSRLMRDNPTLTQAQIRAQFGQQLLDAGTNAAKEATYEAGGTGLGDKVAAARRKLGDPTASVRERLVAAATVVLVPFSKIPDVMLTRGALGLPGVAEARAIASVRRGTQSGARAAKQVMLTEAVNSAIAWQVYNGNITGNGPSDPDKKRVLQNARDANGDPIWQPNSFKVAGPWGTRWIPYSSLGPTAVRVGAIANMMEQLDETYRQPDQNYLDAFSKATGETITDAWYLQNLGRMFQAMKNGKLFDAAGNTLLDFGERYVPDSALAYQLRQHLDPVTREPRNPLEDVANRFPGTSQLVPSRIDPATGQPTQAPRDVLSAVVRSPAPGVPDPTNEELARHNLGVAEAPKTITLPAVGKLPTATIAITDDEQRRYQELTGQYIDQDVRAIRGLPDYKRLDNQQQRKLLQDIIADARKAAAQDMYTALSPEDLNTRIDRYAELERARAEPSVRLSPTQP